MPFVQETFQTIYTQLMATVNRPLTETQVLTGAKWEINQAIKYLQRNQAFAYTERLTQFTAQPNVLFYNLGSICDGVLRDLMSAQLLNQTGLPEGRPLKIMTYNQLQGYRKHYSRTHPQIEGDWYQFDAISDILVTIEDAYRNDTILFIAGQNIGLYPTPVGTTKTILLNLHVWLPTLVNDGDTNFFLTYASDVVMMLALKRMHIYMKSDARWQVTDGELKENIATLIAWDSQVRETPNTTMSPANP